MSGRRGYWRQFSLRGLLVLVTLAAIALGWFAWKLRLARVQDAAAEAIVAAGGQVAYSNQFYGGVSKLTPYQPRTNIVGDWCRKLFGGDPTRKLVSVKLMDDESAALVSKFDLRDLKIVRLEGGSSITDAALAHLANCDQLEVLYLQNAGVTDSGLAAIGRHRKLDELWLSGTQVTDAVLPRLADLPLLSCLDIRRTAITDEGMKQLATLPALSGIYLDNDRVTDEGIRHLHASRVLWSLWLGQHSSANLDLANIAAIPKLEQLYLTDSLITDDRVAALKNNATIRELKFQDCTKLTDESLKTLATMPNLKLLGISSSPFSAPAVTQFKSDRPDCHVW